MKMMSVILALAVVAAFIFLYYIVSPLFFHTQVNKYSLQDERIEKKDSQEKVSVHEAVSVVVGTTGHPASGEVRVLKNKQGETQLRYENFKTVNGPDLYVYLATDVYATDFIDLGRLKATEGDVDYGIPLGTDLERYRYALVWCKAFGVLFNYSELSIPY